MSRATRYLVTTAIVRPKRRRSPAWSSSAHGRSEGRGISVRFEFPFGFAKVLLQGRGSRSPEALERAIERAIRTCRRWSHERARIRCARGELVLVIVEKSTSAPRRGTVPRVHPSSSLRYARRLFSAQWSRSFHPRTPSYMVARSTSESVFSARCGLGRTATASQACARRRETDRMVSGDGRAWSHA